jgi:16S rRNA (adenine1518-N6/adenine1519-N6)-dimethyltransferase
MRLSEMRQILSDGDIQLTKSLGQNFLHDANQLKRIIDAARLAKHDKVLEIGPGLGPLTELLLEHTCEVLAIEKDARLFQFLSKRFEPSIRTSKLLLLHADALDYLRQKDRDWSGWKLVANLPYSVASPILVELAQSKRGPEQMVATLQLEVAKRLMAEPGGPDYGILTLLVQLNYAPQDWFKIPAGCFFPAPDVDSACISLTRRPQPLLDPAGQETFAKIVKRSFSQRRKMMLKLLKADWKAADLERAFERAGLSPSTRAESVTLQQFAQLTSLLNEPR